MASGFVHTVYKNFAWINRIEGGKELPNIFVTKDGAVARGRVEATSRETEHVIHNQDGTIGERHSYGDDPADKRNSHGKDPVSRPGQLRRSDIRSRTR